ncbi:STAS domain-containing protein [Nitrospira sp. Nam74]
MTRRKSEGQCLKLEGSQTVFEAAELHRRLIELLRTPPPWRVDLSDVDYIDTSCLQLLLAARLQSDAGKSFEVTGVTPEVDRHLARLNCVLS